MAISDYPSGFAEGISIRGQPVSVMNPGKMIFVNNSTVLAPYAKPGSDNNVGSYLYPKATIGGALTQSQGPAKSSNSGGSALVASRGDMIVCMPSHAETITAAAGINMNIAGIALIGLAKGVERPTITFTTATTATFAISAADVTVQGFIFKCSVASLAQMVKVTATDVRIEDCRFQEGSSKALIHINVGAANNDSDRIELYRNEHAAPTSSGANNAITFTKNQTGVRIKDCKIYGNFATGAINDLSAAVLLDLQIENTTIRNLTASGYGIYIQCTTSTGNVKNSSIFCDTQANALNCASGATVYSDNSNWGDISSSNAATIPLSAPVAGTTGSPAQANAMPFVITKSLTSSAIVTGGVTVLTANATGSVMVTDYVLRTDSTGLATGTNFTLTTNDVNGAAVVSTVAVSALGANISLSKNQLTAATNGSFTLEAGKTLTAKCTSSSCTGAGTIKIDFYCIPVTAGASVS